MGVTTIDQLKRSFQKRPKVELSGTNKYSGGDMIKTDGAAYEIEGLNEYGLHI